MKKKEKNIITILLLIISITIGAFYFTSSFKLKEGSSQVLKFESKEDVFDLSGQDLLEEQVLPASNSNFTEQRENEVSIFVLSQKYNSFIKEGDTLYQVMENLTKNQANNFSFGFKEYPALGIFVNEINGFKDGDGKYWIYSVNGKEATIGISKYVLQDGDIINWELK